MATASDPSFDPYAEKPTFWQTHANAVSAVAVFVLTVVLTVFCFPPHAGAEFAYVCTVPGVFWAYLRPNFRLYAWTVLGAQALAWTIVLGWLQHVSWLGLLLLGPFMGIWVGVWYLAAWWAMPRMLARSTGSRLLAMFGLAGLWVLLEWTRTWFLSGFPWLPLAASQWQRSVVLQIASYTGAWGVSFILIVFNIGFAAYGHRLLREKQQGLRKRSPEFMVALLCLMLPTFFLIYAETTSQQREPFARIAVVQPDIPQTVKWDPSQNDLVFNTLGGLTARAAATWPDLILWPEASTPHAVKGNARVQQWVEELVSTCRVPLLLGSVSVEPVAGGEDIWKNAAFVVEPVSGLQTASYAKQHLVPFGEYVPLRPLLGWLEKVVPIGGDFIAGESAAPLVIPTTTTVLTVAPLICYEDIFPDLARRGTQLGADVIAVLTNSGWYGTGGQAYQHAAHSVLRAVENRRPVIRCGNNGWSGWIDEFGNIRDTMKNKEGSVYFRGTKTLELTRDARWVGRQSFYTQNGDWFIAFAALCVAIGWMAIGIGNAPRPVSDVEEPEPGRFGRS